MENTAGEQAYLATIDSTAEPAYLTVIGDIGESENAAARDDSADNSTHSETVENTSEPAYIEVTEVFLTVNK